MTLELIEGQRRIDTRLDRIEARLDRIEEAIVVQTAILNRVDAHAPDTLVTELRLTHRQIADLTRRVTALEKAGT